MSSVIDMLYFTNPPLKPRCWLNPYALALGMVKRLAREEGLLVSPSAAAALNGCLALASRIPVEEQAVIVTVFADNAAKYLSERFWDEV